MLYTDTCFPFPACPTTTFIVTDFLIFHDYHYYSFHHIPGFRILGYSMLSGFVIFQVFIFRHIPDSRFRGMTWFLIFVIFRDFTLCNIPWFQISGYYRIPFFWSYSSHPMIPDSRILHHIHWFEILLSYIQTTLSNCIYIHKQKRTITNKQKNTHSPWQNKQTHEREQTHHQNTQNK